MSMERKEKMTCPSCHKVGEFTIWQSINTMIDPEMKSKVRDRSAFAYTCPHCHKTFDVNYGFLYHQMEDQIMIHYCQDEESAKEALSIYDKAESSEDSMMREILNAGYIHRIVLDRNDLLEKLQIFDTGLDDRIIELVKAIYHVQLMRDPDAKDLDRILFDATGDEMELVLFNGEGHVFGTMPLNPDLIKQITGEFSDLLPPIREDKNMIVNFNWAIDQFGKKNKA